MKARHGDNVNNVNNYRCNISVGLVMEATKREKGTRFHQCNKKGVKRNNSLSDKCELENLML